MTTITITITTQSPVRDPGVKKQHIEFLQKFIASAQAFANYRDLEYDVKKNFDCLKPWARITIDKEIKR